MKLNKTMKKFLAYICALAMVVTSITGWQSEAQGAEWVDITGDVGTSTWAYKTVESTLAGSQAPLVYGAGNYVKFAYSADNTNVTVKVNGEDGSDMVFETATGMTTLKFDAVADNTYTAIELRSEQGVLKTIIKKGTPEGDEPTFADEPQTELPEGYTQLVEGWTPMGETKDTTIGTDNPPAEASSWNIYVGTSWSGAIAAAKDGADGQDTVSLYVIAAANGEWGLQLGKVFQGLTAGTSYAYEINYTIDGVEGQWTGTENADANGEIKVVKALGTILAKGQTLTVTSTSCKEPDPTDAPDEVTWLTTDRNLALNKTVTAGPTWREGDRTQITDGICNQWANYGAITVEGTNTGYFDIDLGKTYAASSIDEVVVWWRTGDGNFYPNNGYKIQFSTGGVFTTVAEVKKEDYPATTLTAWADGNQYMIPVVLDKDSISGNVSTVRIFVDSPAAYGAQIAEIGVFAENPQDGVELEKCAAPASVTATSDDYNSITYTVEAGEGQTEAGYKYLVYAGETLITTSEGVEAGTYTAKDVAKGVYKIKAVSICNGMEASDAVEQAEEVTVADLAEALAKENEEQILGTKNITNTTNNADVKVAGVSSYYEGHSLETAGVAIDGVLTSGEGSDVAIRTAANTQPAEIVIDLGSSYAPKAFEKVIIGYSNPRTYAADTTVSFSADNETYEVVAENTGYECKKDNAGTADFNGVALDKIADYTANSVRYVKISLKNGANGYGYVINEIGVILNVDVEDAPIATDKTPVDAPEIQSKEYTGEALTADIEDTDMYTVTTNEGGTDAGSYDVVLTLKDPDNYYWSDDPKANKTTKTLTFEITKIANEWTADLAIEGWTYGEEAKAPTAAAKFGDVEFTYSTSEDGEYTDVVPTDAGTYYVKATVEASTNYEGLEGIVKEFTIAKGTKVAPEGLTAVSTTTEENADGSITGVTDAMEYRAADAEEYTAIEGTTVEGLAAGTYYVRYKDTTNTYASDDTEVVIESGRKLTITLTEGTGYTLTGETEPVEYGTDYTFSLTLNEGYTKDSKAVVKVNGEVVEAGADGKYTVKVTEDIVVEVEGVVEDTPEVTTPDVVQTTAAPKTTTTAAPKTTTKAPKKALARTKITKKVTKKLSAKKVKITFKKVKGAKKYQIQISTSKKFKKTLIKKTVKKVKVTIRNKKLANKKKLYVRVRAVGAKKWSTVKKIKIKK